MVGVGANSNPNNLGEFNYGHQTGFEENQDYDLYQALDDGNVVTRGDH